MIPTYVEYSIVAGGLLQSIDLDALVDEYYIKSVGTITLTGPVSIIPDAGDTPINGEVTKFRWGSPCILNGNTIDVYGRELTQKESLSKLIIECRYNGASWDVYVSPDTKAALADEVKRNTWDGTGDTVDLVPGIDARTQVYITAVPVAAIASYVVQIDAGYVPVEGDEMIVKYEAEITIGLNTITIFGITVPAVQALSGNLEFRTVYDLDTTTWVSSCRVLLDDNIYRVMGSSADILPAYLDSKVAKSITVASDKLELDGDVLAPGNGYYYGTHPTTGVKGWHLIASNTLLSVDLQIPHTEILTLNTIPVEIVGNPGVGKAVMCISYSVSIKGTAGVVVPYITNTRFELKTDTATQPQIYEVRSLISTVDRTSLELNVGSLALTTDTMIIPNKSLYATVDAGNPGGGAAAQILTIHLIYRIIDIP